MTDRIWNGMTKGGRNDKRKKEMAEGD